MARKRQTNRQNEFFGYQALLHKTEWGDKDTWQEAYGYLGSSYSTPSRAAGELAFIMHLQPDKYDKWRIDQIVLRMDDDVAHRVHNHPDEKLWAEGVGIIQRNKLSLRRKQTIPREVG